MSEQSRLDVLEGRVEELSRHWDHLFGEIGRLDHRIETLRGRARGVERSKFDRRFEAVDRRSTQLDQKFDRRFDAVDQKWMMCARSYRGSFAGRSARCWRCWA